MSQLPRPRLLTLVGGGLAVVLVQGGPGWGKSTFVRDWLDTVPPGRTASGRAVVVDLDRRPLGRTALLNRLLVELERAGVAVDPEAALGDSGRAVVDALTALPAGAVAVLQADLVDAGILADLVAQWRTSLPRLRVAVTTGDATALRAGLEERSVPVCPIGEADLAFTAEETTDLARTVLPEVDDQMARHLHRVTGGHPELTTVALGLPDRVLDGSLTRADALGALRLVEWGAVPFERFLLQLDGTSWIPPDALADLVDVADPHAQLDRALGLGILSLSHRPGRRRPALVWEPALRERALAARDEFRRAPRTPDELRRRADVFGRHCAWDLQVAALVGAGRSGEAEQVARQRSWELIAPDAVDLAEALAGLDPAGLRRYPTLRWLREVLRRIAVAPRSRQEPARARPGRLSRDPVERRHQLVLSAVDAVTAADPTAADAALTRWEDLDAGLADDRQDTPTRIADRLLAVHVLLQLDRLNDAGRAAESIEALLDDDPDGTADPDGRRRDHLRLIRITAARAAGDPVTVAAGRAAELVVDPHREADVVLHALLRGWEALDLGRPQEAARVARTTMTRLSDPLTWPLLMLLDALAVAACGGRAELRSIGLRVLRSRRWRERHFTAGRVGHVALVLDAIASLVTGVAPAGPSVTAGPVARGSGVALATALARGVGLDEAQSLGAGRRPHGWSALEPRDRQVALLAELKAALRAGDAVTARSLLEAAIPAAPTPRLAPLALAFLTADERSELDAIVAELPRAHRDLVVGQLGVMEPLGRPTRTAVVLSDREREVLDLLRDQVSNQQMAARLFVSVNTVKFHRANLYRKLGVRDRDAAVAEALRQGL